jgi:outer membrane protein assembly factor BamB
LIKAKSKIALIVVGLLGVSLAIGCMSPTGGNVGCGGPGTQGWSGFTSNNGTLFLGSRNGSLLALNLETRSQNKIFPGEGEWDYIIEVAAPVNPCGPLLTCGAGPPKAVLYSTPAASGDLVYIGTYSGQVIALNAETKAVRWVYPRRATESIGGIVGNLIVIADTIYLGSSNGKIYALDTTTGDLKWEFDTGEKVWTTPVFSDGVVYVGSFNRKVFALSSEDGSQIWQVDLPTAMASTPVVYKDKLIFGAFDNNLYTADISDGRIDVLFEGGQWFWAEPVIKDNIIYAANLDNSIYAIDADTGVEKWQQVAGSSLISKPVLVGDLLVAISESGEMQFINSDNGVIERTVTIDAEVMAPLFVKDDIVYVHARNSYVYAVDAIEANVIWKFKTDLGSE